MKKIILCSLINIIILPIFSHDHDVSVPFRKHTPQERQLIVGHFFNVLLSGYLATVNKQDPQARELAIASALASMTNFVQLVARSCPELLEELADDEIFKQEVEHYLVRYAKNIA